MAANLKEQPCQFFQEGTCSRGKKCRFGHFLATGPQAPNKQSTLRKATPSTTTPTPSGRKASKSKTAYRTGAIVAGDSKATLLSSSDESDAAPAPALTVQRCQKASSRKRKAHTPASSSSSSSPSSSSSSEDGMAESSDDEAQATAAPARTHKHKHKRARTAQPQPDSDSDSEPEMAVAVAAPKPAMARAPAAHQNGNGTATPPKPTKAVTPRSKPKYKTCRYWKRLGRCDVGDKCTFLHPPEEKGVARPKKFRDIAVAGVREIELLIERTTGHPSFKTAYQEILSEAGHDDTWSTTDAMEPGPVGGSVQPFKILGLDCEMVSTKSSTRQLARVTVVQYQSGAEGAFPGSFNTLLDLYIEQTEEVLDYRTSVSGISPEVLKAHKCYSHRAAQDAIKAVVKASTVLVGHSLQFDLMSLKLVHHRVIDTSLVFSMKPLPKQLLSLKDLVLSLFNITCQPEGQSHDSVDDAAWPLDCIRYAVDKLSKFKSPSQQDFDGICALPVPEHYRRRLVVHRLPEGTTLEVLVGSFIALGVKCRPQHSRKLVFRTNKGGRKNGSTILTYASVADAIEVFDAMKGCRHRVDDSSLMQRELALGTGGTCWVKTYLPKEMVQPPLKSAAPPSGPPSGPPLLKPPQPPAALTGMPTIIPGYFPPPQHQHPAMLQQQHMGAPRPLPQAPASMVNFCPTCGTRATLGARFCASCGKPLL